MMLAAKMYFFQKLGHLNEQHDMTNKYGYKKTANKVMWRSHNLDTTTHYNSMRCKEMMRFIAS